MSIAKSIALGLVLAAGVALSAHAQAVSGVTVPGPSIASLPPADQGPRPASHTAIPGAADSNSQVLQSAKYLGPDPGQGWYAREKQTTAVQRSPEYVGPKPN